MNLAARLMQRAVSEDGGVMCELATKRACGGLLQFKARGDFRIKVICLVPDTTACRDVWIVRVCVCRCFWPLDLPLAGNQGVGVYMYMTP